MASEVEEFVNWFVDIISQAHEGQLDFVAIKHVAVTKFKAAIREESAADRAAMAAATKVFCELRERVEALEKQQRREGKTKLVATRLQDGHMI